jgi:DNA-binding GntR family transcriptional regulator
MRAGEALRDAILGGRYRSGQRLVEQQLADALQLSRVPVREALRVLASEGLVRNSPRPGATVATLSHETACEIVEIRATLERLDARLATRHCDAATRASAQALLDAGDAAARGLGGAANAQSLRALDDCNGRCMELIRAAAGNHVLTRLLRELAVRTQIVLVNDTAGALERWHEHSAVLRAMVAGDVELASLLALRRATRAGTRFLAQYGAPCVVCGRGFPRGRRADACPVVVARPPR